MNEWMNVWWMNDMTAKQTHKRVPFESDWTKYFLGSNFFDVSEAICAADFCGCGGDGNRVWATRSLEIGEGKGEGEDEDDDDGNDANEDERDKA